MINSENQTIVRPPPPYNMKEFLRHYKISTYTFYRQVELKNLKITRIGGRVFITQANADAWIKKMDEMTE